MFLWFRLKCDMYTSLHVKLDSVKSVWKQQTYTHEHTHRVLCPLRVWTLIHESVLLLDTELQCETGSRNATVVHGWLILYAHSLSTGPYGFNCELWPWRFTQVNASTQQWRATYCKRHISAFLKKMLHTQDMTVTRDVTRLMYVMRSAELDIQTLNNTHTDLNIKITQYSDTH